MSMDVRRVILKFDSLINDNLEDEATLYLEKWLGEARADNDWKAELTILNELLGQYRKSCDSEKGLICADEAISSVEAHSIDGTATGSTILLNAATVLAHFEKNGEAAELFEKVENVYRRSLEPGDYRFAGLYNNMASAYLNAHNYGSAEKYYLMALDSLQSIDHHENDAAVTYCNLAELYDALSPEDARIDKCMESAWESLNSSELPQDSYHAFTISKCLPAFDRFGYFLYAAELRKKEEKINAALG